MANTIEILIKAKEDATKALKTVESTLGGIDKQVKAVAATYLTYEAVTSSITAVTKAALEEEKQWNKVSAALRLKGRSIDLVLPKIQEMTDSLERETGISDELISGSMYRLIMANYSVAQSYDIARLAADISVATNMSLEDATVSLIRGMNGSEMQLNRLAASLGINIDKAGTAAEKIKLINDQVSGAAQEQLRGYQKITTDLAISWERWKEAVGAGFLSNAAPAMQFVDWWLRVSAEAAKPENDLWAGVEKSAGRAKDAVDALNDAADKSKDTFGEGDASLNGMMSSLDNQKIFNFVKFAEAMSRVKATLPKAFLGDDPGYGLDQLESMNGQIQEVSENIRIAQDMLERSPKGKAKMSVELERFGPTPQELLSEELLRKREALAQQMEAFNQVRSAAQFALDPMKDMILAGQSIGDTFQAMGNRIKQIFVDEIISYIAQAIAKLIIFKGLGDTVNIGFNPISGLLGALGSILPFDNRHNDNALQREVMWVGRLITTGLTHGMMQGLRPQAAPVAAGGYNITIHFHGPVSSDRDIRERVIPQLEEAIDRSFTRIKAGPRQLTGRRNGFSN